MKIVFNGREYDGVEQMPPAVREQYLRLVSTLGDADHDGVPDVLQRPGARNVVVEESIVYDGRTYKSRAELPAEVREALDRLPPQQPGDVQSRVEVQTTVVPAQVEVSVRGPTGARLHDAGTKRALPWLLVLMLLGAIVVLAYLWFSGIRPADLWGR